ncbi:MAG: TetR/AcrR family transcriptional regulator, partial [Solirubrobacteraceae bacterium]
MSDVRSRSYHHGNLAEALVDAALELARAGGPDAIVVREASRRVGVSHNAAYRHFPDRESLLAAVAGRCMERLAALMQLLIGEIAPSDTSLAAARARLRATGRAYVEFAIAEPGLFR